MRPFRYKWRRVILPLIISIFLFSTTLKMFEKTIPESEPLVTISSANQLTENTTTINLISSSDTPSVKIEKDVNANQFIFYQAIWNCLCSRRFMYPPSSQNHPQKLFRLNSSCSDEGTHYQPNQKIISVSLVVPAHPTSLHHSAPSYQISLVKNLIKMRQHYPSYSIRVYTNVSLSPNSSWCKLLCDNSDLFWCDIRSTPSHGNLDEMDFRSWRFLALGDPTVQIFHSRDLDSLIGYREAAAVLDWVENVGYKAFMLMRDNVHHVAPMLAGMWGAQNSRLLGNSRGAQLREEMIKVMKQESGKHRNVDQKMLQELIVTKRARDVVAYDSYHCKKTAQRMMVRPYPVQRQGPERDFIGMIINHSGNGKGTLSAAKCPVECRPSYGKDWIYC